jgi:putative hydrolase of the HAD superfamily
MNFKILEKKLHSFDIIIFDLDDTIYSQAQYDNPALFHVSKYLENIIHENSILIFKQLRKLKKIRRGFPPKLVFNNFIKKKNVFKKKKIISKCINLFQNYQCKELKNCISLKPLLKKFYRKKNLFLVTNGFKKRQKNKIKYLGIKKYFQKIFILDGVSKLLKPSIRDVQYLVKYINKNHNLSAVFIGDNKLTDCRFAKNLKIKFTPFQFPNTL